MIAVFTDFETRAREVEGYFRFVRGLANEQVSLREVRGNEAAFTLMENEDLIRTLKAASYLLLYNLVESTMRNAVEAIFDELKSRRVSFDECRRELREEVLKNLRKRNADGLLPKLISIATDVIYETFERTESFSGNLDTRAIRETAKRFGFEPPTGQEFTTLQSVKEFRNDLAHGVKSFADVGRNASPSDLENARLETVEILTQTLQSISDYLENRLYLVAANSAAT